MTNALGGRRSSLTDLIAENHAKLIREHEERQQQASETGSIDREPYLNFEDVDRSQGASFAS